MKSKIIAYLFFGYLAFAITSCGIDNNGENPTNPYEGSPTITLFDEILFYDGYSEPVDDATPNGIERISNSKYVTKIPDDYVNSLSDKLTLEIVLRAACDNYDRIGNVFLKLVKKGNPYNTTEDVKRIEIARFITPFMDKNRVPSTVPYSFEIDNIAQLLSDQNYNNLYDFWIEFDIFGVPYAANTQIPGCADMNYTFFGTLKLVSTDDERSNNSQAFSPVTCYTELNNYSATDIEGQTTKSFDIDVESAIKNAKMYLITSNHGANAGGEEYNRRNHQIYFDGTLIDTYKPGGESCEPFRQYNTQSNGIYGPDPKSTADWASWNNWCPGNKIPIRIYNLETLDAGKHTFKINVPDAVFVGREGNIPLSVYIQGDKK